jgi:hypothetical protein
MKKPDVVLFSIAITVALGWFFLRDRFSGPSDEGGGGEAAPMMPRYSPGGAAAGGSDVGSIPLLDWEGAFARFEETLGAAVPALLADPFTGETSTYQPRDVGDRVAVGAAPAPVSEGRSFTPPVLVEGPKQTSPTPPKQTFSPPVLVEGPRSAPPPRSATSPQPVTQIPPRHTPSTIRPTQTTSPRR